MSLLSVSPSRILLPRFDTLGDIVLFEGFLEALLQRFPEAKVTLLTRRVNADLACLFPERLEWLVTDVNPHSQPPDKSICAELIEIAGVASPDLVLVTAHNRTWADNLIAANAKDSNRFAIGGWTKMPADCGNVFEELGLSANCPYERTIPVPENSHEVEKYRSFWKALTGSAGLPEPKLYVNEHQRLAVDTILHSLNLQRKKFGVCSPAGIQNVAIKIWPGDRFADIIVWLESERGIRSLVTGHRSEAPCVESVIELAKRKGASPEIWLGRDGDIPLLVAFLEAAQFYLGNDTGPMHMAAAVDTPAIGIFGGGTWPRFTPRGANSIAIAGEMACFGCGWDCIFGDAPCRKLVAVDDVRAAIDLLAQDDVHGPRIFKASVKVSNETNEYIQKAITIHREINQDRLTRFEANLRLEKALKESEKDRASVEADRAARLETIERLTKTLSEVELDRTARLELIERLSRTLSEVESDREARLHVIEQLDAALKLKAQEVDQFRQALKQTQDELDRIRRSLPVRILARLHLMN